MDPGLLWTYTRYSRYATIFVGVSSRHWYKQTCLYQDYDWRLNIPDLPLDSWLVPPPPHHLLCQQCYHLHCPGDFHYILLPFFTFLPLRISGSGLFSWLTWRRFSSYTERVTAARRWRKRPWWRGQSRKECWKMIACAVSNNHWQIILNASHPLL